MGYHDLSPIAFLTSDAVKETNTAEDAALYEQWLMMCHEKLYGKKKPTTDQDDEFSHASISRVINPIRRL